jgi:2-desacetyl-2-hydroxyethyl bacteriochlorophyllide A dehydrogenase
MRAAFFTDQGRFEIRDVPRPTPTPDEVLIDVHACGICGSDLHFYAGSSPVPRVCPGHEICGRIAPGSVAMEPGLAVVVEPLLGCDKCPRCQSGEPNLCPRLRILGGRVPGGFAEAVLVPVRAVYPLPDRIDLDTAVLTEPLAVAVHGVGLAHLEAGNEVLVLGGGAIGLLTAFVAARRGSVVTVSVRHPHQRRAALALGVSRVVDSDRDAIIAASAARQPDVVFETVGGHAATLDLALEVVRPGGSIVALGLFTRPVTLHPLRFLAKEARIVSSMMYSRNGRRPDFVEALELLRDDRERLATLVTHHVPLDEIDRGFAIAADKRSGAIRVSVEAAQKL